MAPRNTNKAAQETPTTDVVQTSVFSDAALRKAETFTELMELTAAEHGAILDAEKEMGDGFRLISDLAPIANYPTLLMEWTFRAGDFGDYVSIRGVSRDNDGNLIRYIYNDGSTGICRQLQEFSKERNKFGGLMVQAGFRVSEYEYEDEKGNTRPAKTWYLAV